MESISESECDGMMSEKDHTDSTSTPNLIQIPWKWDNISKIKEVFKPRLQLCSPEVKKCKDSSYNVLLDVRHFDPSDLEISVTGRSVSIHGVHQETDGGGREFRRKFIFPSDAAMGHTDCVLNPNGVLQIRVSTKCALKSLPHQNVKKTSPLMTPIAIKGPEPENTNKESGGEPSSPQQSMSSNDKEYELFSVALDVRFYDPSEIEVTTSGPHLKVEATHKDKHPSKRSYTSRQFSRTYSLPNEVNPEDLRACVTGGGVLQIMGPKSDGEGGCSESKRHLMVPLQVVGVGGGVTRRRSWVTDALLLQLGRV